MGITCDNALNNDSMVEELMDLLPGFPGDLYRVCCFAHVLNLVAKLLIKHFDVHDKRDPATADGDERELLELVQEMESEEITTQAEIAAGDSEKDKSDDADDEVDGMAELTDEERAQFECEVLPVKLTMAKVSFSRDMYVHSLIFPKPAALKARLQNCALDDETVACMEGALGGPGATGRVDPSRGPDAVEFDI